MSAWFSAPPSASVRRSDRWMICTWRSCFSRSILLRRCCSDSKSSVMMRMRSSSLRMVWTWASEAPSVWVCTSVETLPEPSLLYVYVLVVLREAATAEEEPDSAAAERLASASAPRDAMMRRCDLKYNYDSVTPACVATFRFCDWQKKR